MPVTFCVLGGAYTALCWHTPTMAVFVSPASVAAVMVIAVVIAFWVERAERHSYKMGKLYISEKECRAQSEADWRKAAAERHESEIAKTAAQTELRTRSHFVAWIFHEIRNPLNAMFGAIQMFGTTAVTPKQKEWVKMAMASSKMISNVLDEVLNLSKIEEGNLKFRKSWISIVTAVEEVRFMFTEEAARSGIILECSVICSMGDRELSIAPERLRQVMVYADGDRLKEVLVNFCSNAIKFTESGGSVRMLANVKFRQNATDLAASNDAELDPTEMTADIDVAVTDSGCGILPQDFDKLFVAYSQISPAVRSTGRGRSSTGLGLCITKHIIDAHGGNVYVRSDGPGKGSTFGFQLPVASTPLQDGPRKMPQTNGNDLSGMTEMTSAALEAASSRHHILIVDDDEFNVQVIRDMVESVGWSCEIAENGSRALELIAKGSIGNEANKFSCVVSDCIMPVLDGWQLTRRIRQLPVHNQLPVIGLTGSVSEEDLNRCQEVGMEQVLTKPVKMADLVRTVQNVMRRSWPSPYILLVDDDEFNLAIVRDMLEEAGWRCDTARTGIEALAKLQIPYPLPTAADGRVASVASPRDRHEFTCVVGSLSAASLTLATICRKAPSLLAYFAAAVYLLMLLIPLSFGR